MKCLCYVKAGVEREREVKWSSVLLLLVAGHTLHEVFVLREGRCRERERG